MKRIVLVSFIIIVVFAVKLSDCEHITSDSEDVKLTDSYESNADYYNETEICSVYKQIEERIYDENLGKEEVLEIADEYIKIRAGIDNLKSIYLEDGNVEYMKKKEKKLYESIPEFRNEFRQKLTDKIVEESLVLLPGTLTKNKKVMLNECMGYNASLNDMYIACDCNDFYYVMTKEKGLLFKIYLPEKESDWGSVRHPKIANIDQVLNKAVRITDAGKQIPCLNNIVEIEDE